MFSKDDSKHKAWLQPDNDASQIFVNNTKINAETPEFGAGFPDLSNYPSFLNDVKDLPLEEFKVFLFFYFFVLQSILF